MDKIVEYLPRLLEWVGDKIIFWQTELGSNLVQGGAKIGVKHSLAVTASSEKKSYNYPRNNNFKNYNKSNNNNVLNQPYSEKLGCLFCEGKGHASLFDCEKLKNSNLIARCRFVMSYRLCWHCLERGHIASNCPNNIIKTCDKYLHC